MATKEINKQPTPKSVPTTKTGAPPTQALTRREDTAAVATQMADADLLRDAGAGMEGIKTEDMAIPRLSILQGLSPEVDPRGDKHVDGAMVGMIHENVSHKLYDGEKGVLVVFVHFMKSNIEWIPRKKGGGFVANHGADGKIMLATKRDPDSGANLLPNGNEVVPTAEYYTILVDEEDGAMQTCVVSFSKSDMPEARRLATIASTYTKTLSNGQKIVPALFYRSYRLTTIPKKNDKGSWFGFKITEGPDVVSLFPETAGLGESIYSQAKTFRDAIKAGSVKVKDPSAEGGAAQTQSESAPM